MAPWNAPKAARPWATEMVRIIFYTDGNNVYDQTHVDCHRTWRETHPPRKAHWLCLCRTMKRCTTSFTKPIPIIQPTRFLFFVRFEIEQWHGRHCNNRAHPSGLVQRKHGTPCLHWQLANHPWVWKQLLPCLPDFPAVGIGEAVITSIGSDHAYNNPTLAEGYMNLPKECWPCRWVSRCKRNWSFWFRQYHGHAHQFQKRWLKRQPRRLTALNSAERKMFITLTGSSSFIREVYFFWFQNKPVLIPPTIAANSGVFAEELGAIQTGRWPTPTLQFEGSATLGTFTINPGTFKAPTVNFAGFALASGD